MKKRNQFFAALVLVCSGIVAVVYNYRKYQLAQHHAQINGIITEVTTTYRPAQTRLDIEYEVEGVVHKTSAAFSCGGVKESPLKEKLEGMSIPLIYCTEWPGVAAVLINTDVYSEYNIPVSDSTVWLKDLFPCK